MIGACVIVPKVGEGEVGGTVSVTVGGIIVGAGVLTGTAVGGGAATGALVGGKVTGSGAGGACTCRDPPHPHAEPIFVWIAVH